jgi:hypothetical protein
MPKKRPKPEIAAKRRKKHKKEEGEKLTQSRSALSVS